MSDQKTQFPPSSADDVLDQALDAVQSNIGRIVALFIPILTVAVTAGAYWAQDVIGIDMQQHVPAVVAFVALTATSVLTSGLVWLRNRGQYEHKVLETATLVKAGTDSVRRELAAGTNVVGSGGQEGYYFGPGSQPRGVVEGAISASAFASPDIDRPESYTQMDPGEES